MLGAASAFSQPLVLDGGVVNGASFLRASVPGGAIAQGSIFSIFGRDLGPGGLEAQDFPLPTELGGVTVEIVTNDGELFIPSLLYVGDRQVNAVAPSTLPVGEHGLRVLRDGEPSNTVRFKVVRSSVGVFFDHSFSYSMPRPAGRSSLEPLRPGGATTLWVTGLGPIEAPDSYPAPVGSVGFSVQVLVGGKTARVDYQGRSSCCAGLDQINIAVPADAPLGCFVPVWVELGGVMVSNITTIDIAPSGFRCEDFQDGNLTLWMKRAARIEMVRTFVQDGIADEITGIFVDRKIGLAGNPFLPFRRDDLALAPPPGTCLTPLLPPYAAPFGLTRAENTTIQAPTGEAILTPAPLEGSPDAPGYPPGQPTHIVESGAPSLESGFYAAENPGDETNFEAFTAELDTGAPAIWTNRETLATEPRVRGIDLEISASDDAGRRILATLASSSPPPYQEPNLAVCRVEVVNERLRIPPSLLANIPDSSIELAFVDAVTAPFEGLDESYSTLMTHRRREVMTLSLGAPHLASTPVVLPDGSEIQAELAANFSERQRGLMFREFMPADQGMLFLFGSSATWRFWMLNTLIPLDIIWMNEDREIIFISAHTPPCPSGNSCPTYGPNEPSRFVLELNAGEAAKRGLKVGDRLDW